ncbi:hypothetical protein SLEP1_g3382 [Rubroshorea leprosula]|uniref:Uncharacterized protein n=1 Tax=Rubroshorea leprosula TaxID=152421 RepID=A0AAV5HPJ4_9ROSI|nr:hypothetical protein SLEP1_g3382 [Rubroshorea leprosula]
MSPSKFPFALNSPPWILYFSLVWAMLNKRLGQWLSLVMSGGDKVGVFKASDNGKQETGKVASDEGLPLGSRRRVALAVYTLHL